MKHTLLMAGATVFVFSVAAFSPGSAVRAGTTQSETGTAAVLAQAYPPAPPPAIATPAEDAPVVIAPSAPPPPEVETPPPPPAPTYVWEPGHWSWNGTEFVWGEGKYVPRPSPVAAYVPGHWRQYSDGWGWVPGHWDHGGVGSSTPPQ